MVGTTLGSVLTAIVTPFDAQLQVDESKFVSLFHHVHSQGSDGIVACATTGEAATLSSAEHVRMIELACQERPAGATVVASTGSNNTAQACAMTERATELGADAILSVTPYYNKPNRRGLVRHYSEIARATDKPVMLYNVPSRTAVDMPNDVLAELAQIDGIDYVKQANSNNLALVDGLGIYAGNDDIFGRTLDMGGCGGVLVAGNVASAQMRQMVEHPERRAEIDTALKPLYDALTVTTNPIPVKAALAILGQSAGGLRLPLVEAEEAEHDAIRDGLSRAGLL